MIIISEDKKRTINVGNGVLFSVYSTLEIKAKRFKKNVPLVEQFLKLGTCEPEQALETARQFNMMRDEFAKYEPSEAIYDMANPKQKAPWSGKISPVITSCANLYSTDDGQDLLFEIVSILTYASFAGVKVTVSM